jgi:hypothetical protein
VPGEERRGLGQSPNKGVWFVLVKELFDQNFVQPVDYQLGSDYAPMERLLQADLLGRKRLPRQFEVGPLVGLPWDGSAIKVDSRHLRK